MYIKIDLMSSTFFVASLRSNISYNTKISESLVINSNTLGYSRKKKCLKNIMVHDNNII